MTEYDYSPDALERYNAKMAGVGKWASDQRYHAPSYSNPFVPENQLPSRSRTPTRQETYPKAQPRTHDRPLPTRSRTLPAQPVTGGSGSGGGTKTSQTSRALAYAQQGQSDSRSSPLRTSSRNHQRSGSQPPDSRYPYPTPAPAAVARASPASNIPAPPPGTRQVVQNYTYTPGKPILLPNPRPGERYVIVPPKGGRVEVVTESRKNTSSTSTSAHSRSKSLSHSQSSGSGSGGGSGSKSPTKKGGDPLFKRLITNLTPNIDWGGESSRSGRSSSKRDGNRRRSASASR